MWPLRELRGAPQHLAAVVTASMVERLRHFFSLPPRTARKEGQRLNVLYIGRAGTCNRRNLCRPAIDRTSEWIRREPGMNDPIVKESDYAFTMASFKRSLEQLGTADVLWGPHGAGMAQILFARPGAVLVNIWSQQGELSNVKI